MAPSAWWRDREEEEEMRPAHACGYDDEPALECGVLLAAGFYSSCSG